ncbi:amino acid adenylation domain-containing protein [Pseudomonas sp. sp1636]|uniref:non-ribosomal peptide synthetase n=1 Tax=Pseudomonas sp. sp1636 TaxID=3036707 RepID=UPI0025A6201A|nr:amino acid adenylation domain-containing protein [Pseudomonas sp. sp1636]MDM8348594.1 amino acid adenylation domain-containing protein [Pseudomonas sp. sp1636]
MTGTFLSAAVEPTPTPQRTVLDLILTAHLANPHGAAVLSGDARLSYRELLSLAEHYAQVLRDAGMLPGHCLLCGVDAGLELPVAWLSAMIVGAVLIPVDPRWPANRLTAVLRSTQARVVLLTEENQDSVAFCDILTLTVSPHIARLKRSDPPALSSAQTNLYGFFTSGTTGTPKCALNHHAGLVNRFTYMTRSFGSEHVVYQNSAPLFDSSIWQLIWPLTCGAVTVVPARRERWDLDNVVEQIERHRVSMTDFVPSIFKVLVRALEQGQIAPARLHSLRFVLVGGEAIDPVSVQAFRRILPGVDIINTYGHTEASIGMVFHRVRDEDAQAIPLGQPIDNTYVKIVNEALQPVPQGAIGEILVGGVCVGNGYLNEPELTAKSFLRNPFPDMPGPLVYRTGDRGCLRADGLLEFHGRNDHQVKIRGVRVELDEVRARFSEAFPEARDVAAVVVPATNYDALLALAYTAPTTIEAFELRKGLSRVLPLSHIPQQFLRMKALPISQNGKLDYAAIKRAITAALQAPEAGAANSSLLDCFRQVLGNREFAEFSDFFEWGGDSLTALSLRALVKERLAVNLTLQDLYRNPTPARLEAILFGHASELPAPSLNSSRLQSLRPWGEPSNAVRNVLLTGATGFVGIHILERLLNSTEMQVTVLLRGSHSETALARLKALYTSAFSGHQLDDSRLSVVLGDLKLPGLGIEPQRWEQLSASIDEVIHSAAEVNFLSEPAQLYAANVGGTAELIRFCNTSTFKRLHHVSSLAARHNGEAGNGDSPPQDMNGYGYTKHLADKLVADAQAQGMAARIYRIDDVLPSATTGYSNKKSLVYLLLKHCLRSAMAPDGCGHIGLLPADRLASWICGFIAAPEAFNALPAQMDITATVFVPFEYLASHFANRLGRSVRVIDYGEFTAALAKCTDYESMLLATILPSKDCKRTLFTKPSDVDRQASIHPQFGHSLYQCLNVSLTDFAQFEVRLSSEVC